MIINMKLKKHETKEVNIPDLEVNLSGSDISRRLLDEIMAILRAEIGQRKVNLGNLSDVVKAYDHLEIAGMYILRSQDEFKFDVMKEMKEDVDATKDLKDRTSV